MLNGGAMTEVTRKREFHANQVYNPSEDPQAAFEVLEKGKGLPAVAVKLQVSPRTINRWMLEHEEFALAIEAGQAASELWWDNMAQEHLVITQAHQGDKVSFDTKMYTFTKRTRFRARENDPISLVVNAAASDVDTVAELVKKLHHETT